MFHQKTGNHSSDTAWLARKSTQTQQCIHHKSCCCSSI